LRWSGFTGAGDDSATLLAPVLQGEESRVYDLGGLLVTVDSGYAAIFFQFHLLYGSSLPLPGSLPVLKFVNGKPDTLMVLPDIMPNEINGNEK